jgi:hypothetical protein
METEFDFFHLEDESKKFIGRLERNSFKIDDIFKLFQFDPIKCESKHIDHEESVNEKPCPKFKPLPKQIDRRRPQFFSLFQRFQLNFWFDEHIQNPFPTSEEFDNLIQLTGLTITQLRTFFINKRSRVSEKIWKKALPFDQE